MKKIRNTIALIAMTLFLSAYSIHTIDSVYDPSGVWNYEAESPQGTQKGEMTIEKNDGKYEVTIESNGYGTLELSSVKFSKNTLEAELDIEGNVLDFEMEFDGDSMEGTIYAGEDELSITAERQKKK